VLVRVDLTELVEERHREFLLAVLGWQSVCYPRAYAVVRRQMKRNRHRLQAHLAALEPFSLLPLRLQAVRVEQTNGLPSPLSLALPLASCVFLPLSSSCLALPVLREPCVWLLKPLVLYEVLLPVVALHLCELSVSTVAKHAVLLDDVAAYSMFFLAIPSVACCSFNTFSALS